MKTLQDLVDRLNEFNTTRFSISKQCGHAHLEASDSCGVKYRLVYFADYLYKIRSNFHMLQPHEQKVIIEFLANSTPEDWFAEKKYNIIIGLDSKKPIYGNHVVSAYRKNGLSDFFVNDNTHNSLLSDYDYQFTESEIEKLKSTLPTNMAKIVDLGKVEVKDD